MTDFEKALAEQKRRSSMLGRRYLPDIAGAAGRRSDFQIEPQPNTSTAAPATNSDKPFTVAAYNEAVNPTDRVSGAIIPEAKKKNGSLAEDLLSGAAYGIQANVGRAIPGQSFRQGLLKGIVGAGMAQAAERRAEEASAARDSDFLKRLQMLAYKDSLKPTADEELAKYEAKLKARQPYVEQSIDRRADAAVTRERQIRALEDATGWDDKDLAKIKLDLQRIAVQNGMQGEKLDAWVEEHYQDMLTGGLKAIKKPTRG